MKNYLLFRYFAAVFGIAVLFHIGGMFCHFNGCPWWRHLIFVGVDLFIVYGILKRPQYFIYIFMVFLMQQYYSHGSALVHLWKVQQRVDWISLLVIVYLPIVLAFLIVDMAKKN